MTIVHAAAFSEAMLIAALIVQRVLRGRTALAAPPAASAVVHAGEAAALSGRPRASHTALWQEFLRDRWQPVRRRIAMLPVGRMRRTPKRMNPEPLDAQCRDSLECLPLAALIVDEEGRIELVNSVAEKLFGYARAEMIGAAAEWLVPGFLNDAHASVPARDDAPLMQHHFARRKDGTQFLVEVARNPVPSMNTRFTCALVIDRTDRYELQRNRQELAHLTRVCALGELTASLAHELNQPLTAILSNAQAAQRFMTREPIDLDEVREILSDLVEDNNRASGILRRIRALVKKGEVELAPLNLASVIGDVALLVHSDAIVRSMRVTLDVDASLPPVRGDKVQLQQVMLNLLLNAFDAMAHCAPSEREVVVSAIPDGTDSVHVAVRDRGAGLSADDRDRIFKPFYTSKRDGLGLGLSISRSILDMHGGRIWAESNDARGATIHFTLPAAVEPRDASWRPAS
ncbi:MULTISPECIES: ATP-binding protein [unclassified Caballeronia]|uniref:PAS domain-containing sensor histidine kinase n=1 Tax=unclassified Caballeronia TaxID=2646786 RepID=UPI00285FB06D|nr:MULTISPECIES: ATP-binding protein [unclassified Caballeronia]MDR5754268.1 ATP-binding protein [Caballeronia sp. LZ024]MDR5840646.1 ATP-binding protein [Caballeronia sp. LZ031]